MPEVILRRVRTSDEGTGDHRNLRDEAEHGSSTKSESFCTYPLNLTFTQHTGTYA